ncbi:2-oxoglutarate and iron-dependent oxygenase JMJD4 [Aricia agestis]|uniref:2-oxoglutarate and iron-dependent oxygenase JMJD4 n=1 Tax=Aricia agestis TaxID=91739 RepID=UPI001C20835F|nr:2-oxoglutarate and iron-dependent oxygenase JMJD4 [Aricia agestis]
MYQNILLPNYYHNIMATEPLIEIKDLPFKAFKDYHIENKIMGTIQYSDYSTMCYHQFFSDVMLKNIPCVIKNVTNSWECSKHWVVDEKINYEYLIKEYGELEAPVANCDIITFNSQCKTNMKVKHFMQYLKESNKEKILYLKDWHLKRLRPDDKFYEVPFIFASDWLNEFAMDNKDDDYMFVYIGPKDSWTPFHCDVYSSYSWSVNVVGLKKWILLPPGEEEKVKDSLNNLPILFEPEKYKNVEYIEVYQEKGDCIFVPSGWHHQVFNLSDTISINHNFINSCNIEKVWQSLVNNLVAVENEILEFKESQEFMEQCQLILKSVFGMDFSSFLNLIIYIGKKRLKHLNRNNNVVFEKFYYGKNHLQYDLLALKNIYTLVQSHELFSQLPNSIITNLVQVMDSINKL